MGILIALLQYFLEAVSHPPSIPVQAHRSENNIICAVTRVFQQCGISTSVDSDEPVQPHFKLRNPK